MGFCEWREVKWIYWECNSATLFQIVDKFLLSDRVSFMWSELLKNKLNLVEKQHPITSYSLNFRWIWLISLIFLFFYFFIFGIYTIDQKVHWKWRICVLVLCKQFKPNRNPLERTKLNTTTVFSLLIFDMNKWALTSMLKLAAIIPCKWNRNNLICVKLRNKW